MHPGWLRSKTRRTAGFQGSPPEDRRHPGIRTGRAVSGRQRGNAASDHARSVALPTGSTRQKPVRAGGDAFQAADGLIHGLATGVSGREGRASDRPSGSPHTSLMSARFGPRDSSAVARARMQGTIDKSLSSLSIRIGRSHRPCDIPIRIASRRTQSCWEVVAESR